MWAAVHLLGSIWTTDMHFVQFHPACEWLCTCWAPFELLTLPPWNSIQIVSGCASPGLYSNYWHVSVKPYQVCEWLCTSRALFESLTCFCEILSSLWVAVHLQGSIWITDMPLLNLIQKVSGCAPPGLHLNHWHALMQSYLACEWLCNSGLYFESLIFLLCNLI